MCGIAGLLTEAPGLAASTLSATVEAMAAELAHRGPDDSGQWVDPECGVALGHQRLAIQDLSRNGHQPMRSESGRWIVSFNGEIYNFRALGQQLSASGYPFRGHSDTEVLVAACEIWGIDRALESLNGMFALAAWDTRHQELHLVRDRLGEKPLYYGWAGSDLVFGSDLRALRAHPKFTPSISHSAVALYAAFGAVPAPSSIFEDAWKLPPGHHAVVSRRSIELRSIASAPFWSARDAVEQARSDRVVDEAEALEDLHALLRDSVALRRIADVPVGAFLSGGIDSSLVTALLQEASPRPISTFTIGFDEPEYDESPQASAVARHLGTHHVEIRATGELALDVVGGLAESYSEPFADSSALPTRLISAAARQSIKVCFSGDGGDELFAGYNRHAYFARDFSRLAAAPAPLRHAAARALTVAPPGLWGRLEQSLGPRATSAWHLKMMADKLAKLSRVLTSESLEQAYLSLTSSRIADDIVTGTADAPGPLNGPLPHLRNARPVENVLFWDLTGYLPNDILVKLDRATMAVGLESRLPFLDHRIVGLSWRMPTEMKLRSGVGKLPLRSLLGRYVPPGLTDRPKSGFAVPIGSWLRGVLRGWADELLEENRLRQDAIFRVDRVRTMWQQHLAGRANFEHELWSILMFNQWKSRWE